MMSMRRMKPGYRLSVMSFSTTSTTGAWRPCCEPPSSPWTSYGEESSSLLGECTHHCGHVSNPVTYWLDLLLVWLTISKSACTSKSCILHAHVHPVLSKKNCEFWLFRNRKRKTDEDEVPFFRADMCLKIPDIVSMAINYHPGWAYFAIANTQPGLILQ